MLVHIKELSTCVGTDDWDYDNAKCVSAYKIKNIDKFIRVIQTLKKHHKDILIGDNWYTVEDYCLNFPEFSSDTVPCLYVYVVSY